MRDKLFPVLEQNNFAKFIDFSPRGSDPLSRSGPTDHTQRTRERKARQPHHSEEEGLAHGRTGTRGPIPELLRREPPSLSLSASQTRLRLRVSTLLFRLQQFSKRTACSPKARSSPPPATQSNPRVQRSRRRWSTTSGGAVRARARAPTARLRGPRPGEAPRSTRASGSPPTAGAGPPRRRRGPRHTTTAPGPGPRLPS